jgi:HAD superfamily hydrolase (TIGR01509 family)
VLAYAYCFTSKRGITLIFPRALLFDMDGTITEPMLDFPAIKAEMNIGDLPILETISKMDPERRRTCEAILRRHELAAAESSMLNAGCTDLLTWIAGQSLSTALITRNSELNVRIVLAKHRLRFDTLISREDTAPKPDPRPIHLACERLNVSAQEVWMIGDGRYDIEAGVAAGVRTIWISHGRQRPFAAQPWKSVRDLIELRCLLEEGEGTR